MGIHLSQPFLGPLPHSVAQQFEQQVARDPTAIALSSRGEVWNYGRLNEAANRLAWALLQNPGRSPVLLLLEHHIPIMVALLGVLKAGRPYVALPPNSPLPQILFTLADLGAEWVIGPAALRPELPPPCRLLELEQLPIDLPCTNPTVSPAELAAILYTSGSTGEPKGIGRTQAAILHRASQDSRQYPIRPTDRFSHLFLMAFGAAILHPFSALLNGAGLYLFEPQHQAVSQLAHWIKEAEITVLHIPVTLFRLLCDWLLAHNMVLPSPRIVQLAGEMVSWADIGQGRACFGPQTIFLHRYASTETGVIAQLEIEPHFPLPTEGAVPAGYAVADKELLILDDELRLLPAGQVGQIGIRSPHLSHYWQRPQLTNQAFAPNPAGEIYLTGDLGKIAPDGLLELAGRKDQQLKIRGYRVEPGRIEMALRQIPGVAGAAVVADGPEKQRLLAYWVTDKQIPLTSDQVRQALQSQLPDYLIPARFVQLVALPLTQSGKINYQALPQSAVVVSGREYTPAQNDHQKALISLWEELLNVRPIGIHDNFFLLGGDSLLAMRLLGQIEQHVGLKISLTRLLHTPTIAQLTIQETVDNEIVVPIHPAGTNPPLFCVHGFWGGVAGYNRLAQLLGGEQPFYGLQPPSGLAAPLTTIEKIATHYLSAICQVQPDGPYYLTGYCFGGLVAFEMARQLSQQGAKIGLVAVIESPAPLNKQEWESLWFRPELPFYFLRNFAYWWRDYPPKNRRQLWAYARHRLATHLGWKRASQSWQAEDFAPRPEQLPPYRARLGQLHLQAMQQYQPPFFSGRVHIFRVRSHTPRWSPLPDLGWSKVAKEVEVFAISGIHGDILQVPHVHSLAQALQRALQDTRLDLPLSQKMG